jgi:cytochrome c biogenesis protein CcmG, thiol:disulfide interchange protein DsbE
MRVRRRRTTLVAAVAAGIGVVALIAVLATRPPAAVSQADSPLLGRPAPFLSGPGLHGGTVDLASMRGQFVLVNFFASWCPPCHQEAAELNRLSHRMSLLGVTYNDSPKAAAGFLLATGAHWPAVIDSGGRLAITYGVRAPPESYLIGPDGTVEAKVLGPVTVSQAGYLQGVMDRLQRSGQ